MLFRGSNGKFCKTSEYKMRCQLGMESDDSLGILNDFLDFTGMVGYEFEDSTVMDERDMEIMTKMGLENLMRK